MKEKVNKKELWRGKKEVETYMALQIHMKIDIFILRSDIFNQKKDNYLFRVFFKYAVKGTKWKQGEQLDLVRDGSDSD